MTTVVINKREIVLPDERENTVEVYDADILICKITLVPSELLTIANKFVDKKIGFGKLKQELEKWNNKRVKDIS
jgi:hypothetical protein